MVAKNALLVVLTLGNTIVLPDGEQLLLLDDFDHELRKYSFVTENVNDFDAFCLPLSFMHIN